MLVRFYPNRAITYCICVKISGDFRISRLKLLCLIRIGFKIHYIIHSYMAGSQHIFASGCSSANFRHIYTIWVLLHHYLKIIFGDPQKSGSDTSRFKGSKFLRRF